jgi:hypothetical protein
MRLDLPPALAETTLRIHRTPLATAFLLAAALAIAQQGGGQAPPGEAPEDEDERSVFAIEGHQLGDQTLALNAGLMVPLFFKEFGGETHETNLTVGGLGELQWSAYVTPSLRIGLDIGGAFARSPNDRTLFLMPITAKASWVFGVSRFEFPVSLAAGINIVRYREWSHVDVILKPGVGGYWRYDTNWSFGLNLAWWLDFQPASADQPANQARMGNFLMITPGVFYNF